MRIAFYAPMKPPDHPVPSGDRQLARLFQQALTEGGHRCELASRFVSRDGEGNAARQRRLRELGDKLAARLVRRFQARPADSQPEAWFTYHLYHKAPDWLGPPIAAALRIPYFIAEASTAPKRAGGPWDIGYSGANEAITQADAIFTVNSDDWGCVENLISSKTYHKRLFPFVDAAPFAAATARRENIRAGYAQQFDWPADTPLLLAVGMMRAGAKRQSYYLIAAALSQLTDLSWRLLVVGDGPCREEITQELEEKAAGRAVFLGELEETQLADAYAAGDMLVWPAVDEAFGMALLEAQAAGLPIVASKQRGVPDIVSPGVTGLLPPPNDVDGFAAAIRRLLDDSTLRQTLSRAAASRVREQFDVPRAAAEINRTLQTVGMAFRRR
ncbi:MAG: glycosyltransferase family 4 protein [Alphaproteobacteria bacterium]|nr:glycosyltransferase family 4 protein [Alphaproteobacteria bacterium]